MEVHPHKSRPPECLDDGILRLASSFRQLFTNARATTGHRDRTTRPNAPSPHLGRREMRRHVLAMRARWWSYWLSVGPTTQPRAFVALCRLWLGGNAVVSTPMWVVVERSVLCPARDVSTTRHDNARRSDNNKARRSLGHGVSHESGDGDTTAWGICGQSRWNSLHVLKRRGPRSQGHEDDLA